jgi:hypothetical protein
MGPTYVEAQTLGVSLVLVVLRTKTDMRKYTRPAAVLSTVLILAAGAGIAVAAWNASGSGSGYAKAGTSVALTTVDVSATVTASLYPGATGDVVVKIANPNSYPVTVTAVAGSGAITASGGAGTCTTTGVTFTDQTGLSLAVPAGSAGTSFTLTGSAAMSNASQDGCRNAVFTVPVSLTGASG